jgi:hypothetical protein
VPSGWTLVAFAGNQTTSCPNQTTQNDVYEGPITSNACSCGCAVSTQPTCPTGSVTNGYDTNHNMPTCNMGGGALTDPESCGMLQYTGTPFGYKSFDLAYTPPAATGGACSDSAAASSSGPSYTAQDRICTPDTEPCTGDECTPSFGSGLQICVAASGTMTCPGAFPTLHIVGGAATFTCSDSSCTCSVTAAACTGTVTFYVNAGCTGGTLTIPANGSCNNESNAGSNTYTSYSYAANPLPPASCTTGGSATAQNVTQPNLQTVCCTQ